MTGLLQNLDYFLFSRSVVDLLVCLGSLSCCNLGQALAVERISSHLSLEYFGIQRTLVNSMTVRCLWLQNKPKIISRPPAFVTFGMRCLC